MNLLIDAGNTRVKLALWHPVHGRSPDVLSLAHDEIGQQLPAWLTTLATAPLRAWCVNVAGAPVRAQLERIMSQTGCALEWITPGPDALGLQNGYDMPAQLGPDRWAAMLGLWRNHQGNGLPLLLATFGTATTVDAIGPDACFLGGLILPGAAMMRNSLAEGTARLPLASGHVRPFPTNTHDAISSGMAAAQAGAVLRQWLALRQRYGVTPMLFASGGNWPAVADEVQALFDAMTVAAGLPDVRIQMAPHAVLDGLAHLAAAASYSA